MASSRLEKIGTIFTRINGLLKTGAMKWEDRPLWYDVYSAFPPKDEPRYDRPAPNIEVKNIFYKEDTLRMEYHKEVKPGVSNLFNNDYKTKTRRFIEAYNNFEKIENLPKEELFQMAMSKVVQDLNDKKLNKEADVKEASLAKSFKDAQKERDLKIDVGKIMKED